MTSDNWLFFVIMMILCVTIYGIATAPPYDKEQHDDDDWP